MKAPVNTRSIRRPRRLALAGIAILASAVVAYARPPSAHPIVTFGDGLAMNSVVVCNYYSFS